ncbi:MAG: tannase/feruloyl esterase family alpha/beta hydrolase [Paludibaculum sp.]
MMRLLRCAFVVLGWGSAGLVQAQGPAECASLANFHIPHLAMVITKTEWIPASPPGAPPAAPRYTGPLPAFCRLDAVIDKRTGEGGKVYGIGFALNLPAEWNHRFLMQGGGGLNGSVQFPLGAQAAGAVPGLARGFAVVNTDSGHTGTGAFDASFLQDQQASLDFAYVAVGRGGAGREADHCALLRPAGGAFVFFGLLDRRTGSNVDDPAISALLRWRGFRGSSDAYRLLEPGGPLGGNQFQPDCADRCPGANRCKAGRLPTPSVKWWSSRF